MRAVLKDEGLGQPVEESCIAVASLVSDKTGAPGAHCDVIDTTEDEGKPRRDTVSQRGTLQQVLHLVTAQECFRVARPVKWLDYMLVTEYSPRAGLLPLTPGMCYQSPFPDEQGDNT